MTVMVFDIETVPDWLLGKQLLKLVGTEEEVIKSMLMFRRQHANGSEFLPYYYHKIIAISVVVRHQDWVKVWSLGEDSDQEFDLINKFFYGIQRFTPILVSWNGNGFDLPVLHYRALKNKVSAPSYWETGSQNPNFKWNNYLNRYHERHLDLMDILALYQTKANAPLDDIATMLGFPGKLGIHGYNVLDMYLSCNINAVREYCETDVLNTYLIYLRFQLMRGILNAETYASECAMLQNTLQLLNKPHLNKFLESWTSK